jgi:hypothetical protein
MEADGNYIIEKGHAGIRWMLEHVENSLRSGYNAKIHWGARSIYRHDWLKIKPFLKEHNIKNVLEYGVGLSTELMLLEGIKVTSLETLDWWTVLCRKAFSKHVPHTPEIIHYKEGFPPEMTETFDLCFVDAPQTKRRETIIHAKERSNLIFIHDKRPEEVELLSDWFPVHIDGYEGHFYSKVEL